MKLELIILSVEVVMTMMIIAAVLPVYGQGLEQGQELLQKLQKLEEGLSSPTPTGTPPPLSLDSFLSPLEIQWGNATYDAYNHLQEFEAFQEVCDQYNKLKVESEVRGCLEVYNSFNNYMDQLRTNHSEIINKNLNISLQ
jgi:hypothetical protein